jgi:hypothetical protein
MARCPFVIDSAIVFLSIQFRIIVATVSIAVMSLVDLLFGIGINHAEVEIEVGICLLLLHLMLEITKGLQDVSTEEVALDKGAAESGKFVEVLVDEDDLRKCVVMTTPAIWLLDSNYMLGFHDRRAQATWCTKKFGYVWIVYYGVLPRSCDPVTIVIHSGIEDAAVLMKAGYGILHLGDMTLLEVGTPSSVAEVEEGMECSDHGHGNMSFKSR